MTFTVWKDQNMARCLLVHPGAELFGADRMLLESAVAVKESGMECLVALPGEGPLAEALRDEGIQTETVPMFVLRKALLRPRNWVRLVSLAVRGLLSSWKLITRTKPDCIYVSTITLPQWPLVGRLRGIRSITHVHEAEGSASRWVNMAIYLPHMASATVLVNSRFSLRTLARSLPGLAERAKVVDNGVAGPPTRPKAPREALDGVLRVLYLGRLSHRKGPDLIVGAASRLREKGIGVRLVMAGSVFAGYEWYEAELRANLRDAGFEDEEVLVGFRESIWPLLDDCDVLVVPSRLDEPFGNTAVEGVLAHRPVIVSDTTGLREAAAGYPTARLIQRDDSDALAQALEGILKEWETVRSLVGISAERAWDRHDPGIYRQRIGEAVTQVIAERQSSKGR